MIIHPFHDISPRLTTVTKKMMEMMGKPGGPSRPPLVEAKPEEIPEIQKLIGLYKP